MKREISDRTILDEFTEDFCEIVEKHCKYFICSGFSAIASGRSRGTEDIDMIIEKLNPQKFIKLHNALVKAGFECIQSHEALEIFNYLDENLSIRYVKKGEYLPEMELHFSKDILDEIQLKERIKMPFTKLDIYFAPLEGNIAFKEDWLKSDKDMEDAKHLRIVYQGEFDEERINKFKRLIKEVRLKNAR
ncbi:MAG TPA: hypothetical protein VJB35_04630 [Candidatus Nanoarchaeia archaeon]|nr:hypothetical protein [Candidatus Nanoarchaeia archaeon]